MEIHGHRQAYGGKDLEKRLELEAGIRQDFTFL